jgi:hypothetical protein
MHDFVCCVSLVLVSVLLWWRGWRGFDVDQGYVALLNELRCLDCSWGLATRAVVGVDVVGAGDLVGRGIGVDGEAEIGKE